MNQRVLRIALAAAGASLVLSFLGWRLYAARTQQIPHYELLGDVSYSHPNGCQSLVGLADDIMRKQVTTAQSQLSVLVVGDETTSDEPTRIASYVIPTARRAIESPGASGRQRQELLTDLLRKCQAVRNTNISPIFAGIQESLADLRAKGCSPGAGCKLFVDTDGEENVQKGMRQLLSGGKASATSLPPPLDNSGIEVTFCGLAVTAPRSADLLRTRDISSRGPSRQERVQLAWRSAFSNPELIRFEPYCPKG